MHEIPRMAMRKKRSMAYATALFVDLDRRTDCSMDRVIGDHGDCLSFERVYQRLVAIIALFIT